MYVPVGDITDFLDEDDFYGEMAQRFAAAEGFKDRYAATAAANIIGAENQFKIDLALDALNQSRDERDGSDAGVSFGLLEDPRVQSTIGSGIKGLFNSDGGMGFPQVGGTNDFYQSPEGFILPNPT